MDNCTYTSLKGCFKKWDKFPGKYKILKYKNLKKYNYTHKTVNNFQDTDIVDSENETYIQTIESPRRISRAG